MAALTEQHFLHLPYHEDYTLAGLEDVLRHFTRPRHGLTLPAARALLAQRAAELALRRLLAAEAIPHDNLPAAAFQAADRFEIALGGRRCSVAAELITAARTRARFLRRPAEILGHDLQLQRRELQRPTYGRDDLWLGALVLAALPARAAPARALVHLLPAAWASPARWQPLADLALKSEHPEPLDIELIGLDARRAYQTCRLTLPPARRVTVPLEFYSLAAVRAFARPQARLGLHCPAVGRQPTLLGPPGWRDLWLAGEQVIFAGYTSHAEISRRARPHPDRVSLHIRDLRPLPELFAAARAWAGRG